MKKLHFLSFIALFVVFTSCQFNLVQAPVGNYLSSNNIFFNTETDNNSEETDQFILKGRIEIEGAVPSLLNGQNNASQNYFSKTAMPANPAEIIYKFTMRNTANSIIGDAGGIAKQSEGGAYEISISPRTRKLDVFGYACATEPECATGNRILKGSANITDDDIEAGNSVDVVVSPYATGTGTVNLNIVPSAPSLSNGYMVAKWTVGGSPKTCTVPTNGNLIFYLTESRISEPVDCGVYEVEFSFYNSDDVLKYRCTEKINVFPNMETDTWVGGGSVHISNGIMNINSTCINIYNRHEFFVSDSPVSGGTGTYFDPVTLPEAVKFITSLNDEHDYTIYLKDDITLASDYTGWPTKSDSNPEKSYVIINPASNLKLKICSYGNPATPYTLNANCSSTKQGRVMFIGSKADVTLENIVIKGGNSYVDAIDNTKGYGSGIFVDEGKLTLGNKTVITENYFTNDQGYGAGIYSNYGTIIMESGSEISYNGDTVHTANGGGIYSKGDNSITKHSSFKMEPGSKVFNNIGNSGAGIKLMYAENSYIHGAEIYNNQVYSQNNDNGGGVWASVLSSNSLEISDTKFIKNTANCGTNGGGGAIYVQLGCVKINGTTSFEENEGTKGNAISINNSTNQYIHIEDSVKFVHDIIKQTVSYDYDNVKQIPYIKLGNLTGTSADQTIYLTLNLIAAGDRVVEAADASVDLSQYVGNFVVLDSSLNETDYYIDSEGKLAGELAAPPAAIKFTPKTAAEIAAAGYLTTYTASDSFPSGTKLACSSVEQLAIISEMSHAGKSFEGVEILLTDSIDVGSATITLPMSTAVYPFNGTFDGNGNSITRFGITGNGFFDGTLNATIKNLKLEGSVSADSTNAVGGLIGTAYGDTTIENCELTVNVTTTKDNVGGIVGNAIRFTNTDNFKVRNCINNSEVSGGINVGGIAGAVGDYASVVIENCLNNGNITSTNLGSGIVSSIGSSDPTIKNCVNTGRITGTGSVGISASLAGSTAASVQNCFNLTTASSNLFLGATIYDTDSCCKVDYYGSTLAITSDVTNAQGTYPVNTDVAEILNYWCRANPSSSCYTWKYKGGGGTVLTFE